MSARMHSLKNERSQRFVPLGLGTPSRSKILARTMTNEFCEFELQCRARRDLSLQIPVGHTERIEVRFNETSSEPAKREDGSSGS